MKKNVLIFISGMICMLIVGVGASTIISGNDISYDNSSSKLSSTKIQGAIDELNNTSTTGKTNIINKLNTKGLELGTNATYQNIIDGIESLPIGKTNDGKWGYIKEGTNQVIAFGSGTAPKTITSASSGSFTGLEIGKTYFLSIAGTSNITGGSSQNVNALGLTGGNISLINYLEVINYQYDITFIGMVTATNSTITLNPTWSSIGGGSKIDKAILVPIN